MVTNVSQTYQSNAVWPTVLRYYHDLSRRFAGIGQVQRCNSTVMTKAVASDVTLRLSCFPASNAIW